MTCSLLKTGYDQGKLQTEIDKLEKQVTYYAHPGQKQDWSGFALRNIDGSVKDQRSILLTKVLTKTGMNPCADTEYMKHTPYIKEILTEIPSEVHLVRVLKIKAKGKIPSHSDGGRFSFQSGSIIRFHLPIQTNPAVKFEIDKVEYYLAPGNLYALDVAKPHTVINESDQDRIHLVFDVTPTPELRRMIEAGMIGGKL